MFTRNAPEKQESWTWGASRRQKNRLEMIEEMLKGLVARGQDGARVFSTIFRRKVRVLSALRGKIWDYEHDEPPEELQDPGSSGLWRWLDSMIAGEGCRPIGGPSPSWSGSPTNLVSIHLVFDFLFPPAVFPFLLVLSLFVIVGSWQVQVSPPSRQRVERGRSPGRAVEEGCEEEEEEGAPCPGA